MRRCLSAYSRLKLGFFWFFFELYRSSTVGQLDLAMADTTFTTSESFSSTTISVGFHDVIDAFNVCLGGSSIKRTVLLSINCEATIVLTKFDFSKLDGFVL
ncbi:hypothetical protein BDF20DRAFT_922615 [Mycotypha africana]|uniref:uncharacterized protein n=1 Tax=Mycotypha africana TaxID=64632 RepID=UPI002300518B|nr:uncharacterized protein BDF20DRAFT_922615 [Mycotypha africana]KAI8970082.1 hypothetical protein BDF20DRAFT_922615 [Mycotypha africana]